MIDTHCHLTFPDFAPDQAHHASGGVSGVAGVAGVLTRARDAGVTGCITICTTTQEARTVLAMARAQTAAGFKVWCSTGVHPLYSDQEPHDWSQSRSVIADPLCVAWGELGLDNHYADPPRPMQDRVLGEQLAFIASCRREGIDKPVVIHCREAFADLIPVLRASSLPADKFVFHCFTGDSADMRALLDFGACVSFTGVATYKNAPALREAIRLAPLDRIMIETDAPFLSPHPHRGVRPCEPWMASVTARGVAELRGEDWEQFHHAINENTRRFFGVEA